MTHWTCDRCAQAIEHPPATLFLAESPRSQTVERHFCEGCAASFGAWWSAVKPINPEPEPKPESEPEAKPDPKPEDQEATDGGG